MISNDFLSIRDFTPEELTEFIELARLIKTSPELFNDSLKGQTLALIFEKPSLRTRVSFDVGIHQLGGHAIYLSPSEINLGKRESVEDVGKNLERMVQGIMIRTFSHEIVEQMAEWTHVPVINGLTDFSHPCQALADYLTILECKEEVRGKRIAYIGDGNNVAHSLLFCGIQLGASVRIATPPGYEPNDEAVRWAKDHSGLTGGSFLLTHDPAEAASGADVIYTDVWTSMGQEDEQAERSVLFRPYQVDASLLRLAKPDVTFMHCLPAHRGDEVTAEVIDGLHSVVYQQAENRVHAQKAIMVELMKHAVVDSLRSVVFHLPLHV
ncbi:MAG: ornithine carbamoyltransferase [Candidatus Acidiferrum sp.]